MYVDGYMCIGLTQRCNAKDVKRSTLTQQPTTPWSSLLQ